mmetsp:Transcript_30353/g.99120  ORF Transcript_30353/g.99120 Transcript_30353/m.99120 type:complete len:207 (+) Transcript_30353:1243-1863(+)
MQARWSCTQPSSLCTPPQARKLVKNLYDHVPMALMNARRPHALAGGNRSTRGPMSSTPMMIARPTSSTRIRANRSCSSFEPVGLSCASSFCTAITILSTGSIRGGSELPPPLASLRSAPSPAPAARCAPFPSCGAAGSASSAMESSGGPGTVNEMPRALSSGPITSNLGSPREAFTLRSMNSRKSSTATLAAAANAARSSPLARQK